MTGAVPGYAELEFDLPGALLRSVVGSLDALEPIALLPENTLKIPEQQGVYQLFLRGEPVYVGKTDADAGLAKRLFRHSRKIQHRTNLDPSEVSFKAIRVYVFTTVDIETDLIRHYGAGAGLAWDKSGFGSNDPGRQRDTTNNKPENFDFQFPADIDRVIDFALPESCTAAEALRLLKRAVPYTVRAPRQGQSHKLHSDLEGQTVSFRGGPKTLRAAMAELVGQLPAGWQATKLLGYVILYKEDRAYPQSEIIARS
ncbi:MAG: GIY-YIG nuclease family protein [Caulobacter sp.]|nr:GIY-YIG nuclease family protein [Caulobacter sp.]